MKVQVFGVFDTIRIIKMVVLDLSSDRCTQRVRHALALHEDRDYLALGLVHGGEFHEAALEDSGRSLVQA